MTILKRFMRKLLNRILGRTLPPRIGKGRRGKKGGYRGVLMGVGAPMEDTMMPMHRQGKGDIDLHNGKSLEQGTRFCQAIFLPIRHSYE